MSELAFGVQPQVRLEHCLKFVVPLQQVSSKDPRQSKKALVSTCVGDRKQHSIHLDRLTMLRRGRILWKVRRVEESTDYELG